MEGDQDDLRNMLQDPSGQTNDLTLHANVRCTLPIWVR